MHIRIKADQSKVYPYPLEMLAVDFPLTCFAQPFELSDLAAFGVYPVAPSAKPAYLSGSQSVDEEVPINVAGVWTQQWTVRAATEDEIAERQQALWVAIQDLRDTKTQLGGFPVGGKWFHSNTFSRTQQLGLKLLGASMPGGLQWKTMDGTFVTMSPTLAGQILASAAQQEAAMFTRAEVLRAQVRAAAEPASIDLTAGWPATFGGI